MPGPCCITKTPILSPELTLADRVAHVQPDALLAHHDRADIGLGRGLDDRVDRIADQELDPLRLQDMGDGVGDFHRGLLRDDDSSMAPAYGIAQADRIPGRRRKCRANRTRLASPLHPYASLAWGPVGTRFCWVSRNRKVIDALLIPTGSTIVRRATSLRAGGGSGDVSVDRCCGRSDRRCHGGFGDRCRGQAAQPSVRSGAPHRQARHHGAFHQRRKRGAPRLRRGGRV